MPNEIPAGHTEQHSSERVKQLIVVLVFAALVLSAVFYMSYQRFSQISATGTEVPDLSRPALESVPIETPPKVEEIPKLGKVGTVQLPVDLEQSHFGFVNAKQSYAEIYDFGVRWDRALPGPFNWNTIGHKDFNFDAADRYVRAAEDAGFAILAVIWPYNDFDQQACHSGYPALDFRKYEDVASRTGPPCSEEAYQSFIGALVERYDGDGRSDMPGLKYPIKYWEVASNPEVQDRSRGELYFTGDGVDYAKLLTTTYGLIKEADPDAKVLHGSIYDTDGRSTLFWDAVYRAGPKFDITAVQCTQGCDDEMKVKAYNNVITKYITDKPIWVTEVAYKDAADEEQAKNLFKGYTNAFGNGAQKIFYDKWRITAGGKEQLAALNTQTERRKSYYAMKAVVEKIGAFTSVEKFSGGYKFKMPTKNTYAFFSAGELPSELRGTIAITDFNGTTKTRSGAFNLFAGEIPSFVEFVEKQ